MMNILRQAETDEPLPRQQQEDGGPPARGLTGMQSLLDAQRDRIHQQLQELQRVVLLQCRITGTNPLAQEMAAAVLGKRTGKRSGESLTPRALKCLYNVFSIKDTITKKEAREISALSGATVTQVREFFSGQRSRVRKVMQLSHGEAMSGNLCLGGQSLKMDPSTNGLHNGDDMETLPPQTVDSQSAYHSLLNVFNSKADGGSSKLNAVEKAEHLINVMRKENTFTGQSQLAQSILQAHGNILRCFMARGGLQQIIKWLMQAAVEEQTSLIRLLLKTITQLPLGSALPRQMSSLLQTVNKLRFYRAQDVAGRARLLLSRWSRFFRSTQNGKMPSSTGLVRTSQHAQKRIRYTASSHKDDDASKKKPKTGIMVDSCGQLSNLVSSSLTTDKAMHPSGELEITMEINSMRKQLGSSFIQGDRVKGKRKVQLFEEARAAVRRKNAETAKSSTYESAPRPLSADDIKKAKRRAFFLNSANAQKPSSSRSNKPSMLESSAVCSFARQSSVPFLQEGRLWRRTMKDSRNNIGISDVGNRPENALESTPLSTVLNDPEGLHEKLEQDVSGGEVMIGEPSNVLNTCVESVKIEGVAGLQGYLGLDFKPSKISDDVRQTERCRAADSMDFAIIQWATPPRISLDPRWRVASGEQSTETGFQSLRLSNEQTALYPSPECIPPNPEEPAERVSLFVDDTLVPEILLEALDEESHDRDGSLQSPRYLESARARGQETDSKKLNTGADVSGQGVSSFGEKGCDRRLSVELDMAIKHTDSLEPSFENKQESSLLFVSKGFDQSKPMNALNGTLDTIKILCANPSELKFATPLDQSLEVGTELPKTGLCIPLSQLKRKENVSEHREQTVAGSCLALKDPEAEALADALGRKDMSTPFQKGFGIAKDPSPDNLQFPLLLDHSLNASAGKKTSGFGIAKDPSPDNLQFSLLLDHSLNASAGKKTSGWNLSELSKEACLDLLKIVLQQLSDNGKGSGPDLELLSVFLKNPELVFALMATQAGSLGKDLASDASAGNDSNANNASSILKDLVIQVEKLVGRNVLNVVDDARENEREGTPTSLPSLHVIIPPISRPIAAATPQLRLPLPAMPPPLPRLLPVIDQEVQPHNCRSKVVDSTQFSQQPSPQADMSRLSEDLALDNSGYDWSRSYDLPHSYSQEDARSARPSTQTPVPTRPSVGRCSSLSEYPPSQPGSIQLPMTRASQPPNRPPTIQIDLVRSSMFRYGGGHGQLNPSAFHVETQERAKNRKNGFSFADVPNAPLLRNVHSRDSGISAGILPVPEVAHTNHRVQPSKMMQGAHIRQIEKVPVFMPDVRVGSIPHPVMGNRIPAHLNFGRFCHDQNFRPLQPSSSCLHSLHSPLPHARSPPSFVLNSFRPQGNTMMWKPPLSNSGHHRHTRPGWREG